MTKDKDCPESLKPFWQDLDDKYHLFVEDGIINKNRKNRRSNNDSTNDFDSDRSQLSNEKSNTPTE